jgi:3-oxoacyl-[acyl-carrier-protein] synthase II
MAEVTGIGWVTSNGMGRGKDGFDPGTGPLPQITRREVFTEPFDRFGRMDEFSRVGLTGITLALRDAGLDEWCERRSIGLFGSTVHGCLDTDMAYFETVIPQGGALASPNLFAYTLPSCFLGEAAIRFGLTGPSLTFFSQTLFDPAALLSGLESLYTGECEQVVAGGCDVRGFTGGGPYPQGALFFVLERRPRGEPRYGSLDLTEGGGLICNNTPVTTLFDLVERCLNVRSDR